MKQSERQKLLRLIKAGCEKHPRPSTCHHCKDCAAILAAQKALVEGQKD